MKKTKKMVRILGAVIMTGAMAFTIAGCLNTESEETAPAQSTVIDETRYSSDNTAPVTDTVPAALKAFNKIYNSRNFIRYLNTTIDRLNLVSTTVEILFGT